MKYLLLLYIVSSIFLNANEVKQKESITNKNIEKQIQKEKKYTKEQRFYQSKEYDLKGAEVNMESVKNLPDVEDTNEGFNMDDVYD